MEGAIREKWAFGVARTRRCPQAVRLSLARVTVVGAAVPRDRTRQGARAACACPWGIALAPCGPGLGSRGMACGPHAANKGHLRIPTPCERTRFLDPILGLARVDGAKCLRRGSGTGRDPPRPTREGQRTARASNAFAAPIPRQSPGRGGAWSGGLQGRYQPGRIGGRRNV
jgi:hypothetical protein